MMRGRSSALRRTAGRSTRTANRAGPDRHPGAVNAVVGRHGTRGSGGLRLAETEVTWSYATCGRPGCTMQPGPARIKNPAVFRQGVAPWGREEPVVPLWGTSYLRLHTRQFQRPRRSSEVLEGAGVRFAFLHSRVKK